MADHPPSWPSCPCDRCFADAARAVIGGALPAIVAGAFAPPAPQPPAAQPRPRPPARRKPVRRRHPRAAPTPVAAQADEPRPERTCRVCGDTAPAGWAQANLCADPDCLTAAARAGRERTEARRTPTVARAKRLSRIARVAGKRERIAAAAERDELRDDDSEDFEERLDHVPEVMP